MPSKSEIIPPVLGIIPTSHLGKVPEFIFGSANNRSEQRRRKKKSLRGTVGAVFDWLLKEDTWGPPEVMAGLLVTVILIPLLFATSGGQLVGLGTCPLVRPARKTTFKSIQGDWYEQLKFISPREIRYNCLVYSFGPNSLAGRPSGNQQNSHHKPHHRRFRVRNRQQDFYWDLEDTLDIPRQGVSLNVVGPSLPSAIIGVHKLTGKITALHGSFAFAESTFSVISVDYPNLKFFPNNFIIIGYKRNRWMVLYSCTNYGFFHIMQILVLTANRVPSKRTLEYALDSIRRNDLPKVFLKRTNQSKCTTS
ncbi:uncharacterized protein LOC124173966 [Ischnura elegans]|uniref:uncharacterized protein LOC124173966 n=1 Tax=Ischnura elegans TaxID=197161 RepID=UPI001ED89F40|nr:uncharacterized protein LOC124173966 [Ischnura elegans]